MTQGPSELDALRVLIVEDEFLLAADLRDLLVGHGHSVVGPVAGLREALNLAREASIDLGILDVHIRGGYSAPVAEVLAERGCPFLYITGYGPSELPQGCYDAPVLTKPIVHSTLLECLSDLANQRIGPPNAHG